MSACATGEGPLESTVANDVFTFRQTNSPVIGEMTGRRFFRSGSETVTTTVSYRP